MDETVHAKTAASISREAKELADVIRHFVRVQKPAWQKLPWLALQADGQSGYSDSYGYCYKNGYWPLRVCVGTYFNILVDCETGELVNCGFHPEQDRQVLVLAHFLESLDTRKIIADLEAAAALEIPRNAVRTYHELLRWRKEIIKEIGLTEIYKRRPETNRAA